MTTKDLNTTPYSAPLTFPLPTAQWIRTKTRAGTQGTHLTIPDADFRHKWVIITGANNGIGRCAAIRFAAWGASVVLGCRKPPPYETHPEQAVAECIAAARAAGHKESLFEWWEIDMGSLASVEAFAERWDKTGRVVDVLCNNAGMGSSPVATGQTAHTADGFEIIHQVNFLSHVLLTLKLLPNIARSSHARITCTTSCYHYPGIYDLDDFNSEKKNTGHGGVQYYKNNKLYFQIWLTELQHRLNQHEEYKHITINGLHPGYVNSGVWHLNNGPMRDLILGSLLRFLASWVGITPEQGSLAILNVAASPDAGKAGGRYFNRLTEDEAMPHCRDPDARLRVWRKVNDELKLQQKGLLDVLGLEYIA